MPAPLFHYRQNDPLKNVNALERLILAANTEGATNTPKKLDDVIHYSAIILSLIRAIESRGLADSYATQILSYITTSELESIAQNPNAAGDEGLNEIAIELFHCSASLGGIEDIVPYTPEELNAFQNENSAGPNHAILALTAGYAIMNDAKGYGPALLRILMNHQDEELKTPYEWMDAFLLGLLIHAVWSYFPSATDREQQLIIQRYFYYGFVCGVPVRAWLGASFDVNSRLDPNTLMQKLFGSQEVIPENTNLSKGADFSATVRAYTAAVSRNSIPTLAAEKFLGSWYGNDETGKLYREWLRSGLGTVYALQTGTL